MIRRPWTGPRPCCSRDDSRVHPPAARRGTTPYGQSSTAPAPRLQLARRRNDHRQDHGLRHDPGRAAFLDEGAGRRGIRWCCIRGRSSKRSTAWATSTALVQAPSLSRIQLDSLFWVIVGAACLVAGLTLLVAPYIASLYGIAGVGAYFLAVAVKQPLVGAAVIRWR